MEEIWAAYPEDRRRNRSICERWIADATDEVGASELLAAIKAYDRDSAGFTRSKVSFSDNWFRNKKWEAYISAAREKAMTDSAQADACLATAAGWIKSRHSLCRHLSARQVREAIAQRLISATEAESAGFGRDGRHV